MKFRILFNEGGDGGSGGGGGGGNPPASSSFLGGSNSGGGNPPGNNNPPPAGGDPPAAVHFFRDNFAKEGKFAEGWSEQFSKMGLNRLASRAATAKDEAGFFKMVDDTIGHASGRKIARPAEGASDQDIADYRTLVGAPEKSADYGFLKEGLPQGATREDALAEKVEGILHKHHASKELAAELSAIYLEQLGEMKGKGEKALTAKIAESEAAITKALKEEHGENYDNVNVATEDFLTARGVDFKDPLIRYALMQPAIARIVGEARLASREAPLPGVKREVFSGSGSPRQQAQAIMEQDRNWRNDPAKAQRVADLYEQDAAAQKRKAGAR